MDGGEPPSVGRWAAGSLWPLLASCQSAYWLVPPEQGAHCRDSPCGSGVPVSFVHNKPPQKTPSTVIPHALESVWWPG